MNALHLPKVYQVNPLGYLYDTISKMEPFRGKVISTGFLRQSVATDNQVSSYEFDFYSSDRVAEYPDVKLNDKDVFASIMMALCLAKVNTQKVGAEVPYAYPNSEVFTATGVTPADLEAFYNGHVSIQIDQTEIITRHLARQHYEVPETYQKPVETGVPAQMHDAYLGLPGLRPLPFAIMFNGKQETTVRWQIPKFAAAGLQTTDANTEVRIIMYHVGFFIKGAAEAHYRWVENQKGLGS